MTKRARMVIVTGLGLVAIAGAWFYRSEKLNKVPVYWIGALQAPKQGPPTDVHAYDMPLSLLTDGRFMDATEMTVGHWKSVPGGVELRAETFQGMSLDQALAHVTHHGKLKPFYRNFVEERFKPRSLQFSGSYLHESESDADIWYQHI